MSEAFPKGELLVDVEEDVPEVPLRPDGTLDVSDVDIGERAIRSAFVAQLPDLCHRYGAAGTIAELVPLMRDACQYDDAAINIANVLTEIGNVLLSSRSDNDGDAASPRTSEVPRPFTALLDVLRDLFVNVDLRVGAVAARVAVALARAGGDDPATLKSFVDTACELAAQHDAVSSRCAAARMLAAAHDYARIMAAISPETPKAQQRRAARARSLFAELVRDSSTAVRRAAAAGIGEWLAVGQAEPSADLVYDVQAWTTELIKDRLQDSVRYAALPHIVSLARLGDRGIAQAMVKLAQAAARDVSWRVRWTAAQHIVPLLQAHEGAASAMLDSIGGLARDEEVEVRSCVAQSLGLVAPLLPPHDISAKIVPLAVAFAAEEEIKVRAAVAGSLCDICRAGSDTDAKQLIELVETLIGDGADAVQFNVLRSLPALKDRLTDVVVMNRISALLLRVSQVSVSRWRVRERVAEQLRHLAPYVDTDNSGAFESMLHSLLRDPVAAVRATAMASLPPVASRFGPRWTRVHIGRFAQDLREADGYRERHLYVQVLEAMLPFAVVNTTANSLLHPSGSSDAIVGSPQSATTADPQTRSRAQSTRPDDDPPASRGASGFPNVASDLLSGSASSATTPPPLSQSQTNPHPQEKDLSPFWRGIADDVRSLARDKVPNVRLAVCRWLHSPGSAHVPQLSGIFAEVGETLASDADGMVRAASTDGGRAPEATPY
uniref:Uncharacterized protein n=1 Tax=Neobodo designis TaxID=312471 RepID=A0A7S1MIK9_NEODS|mmetsp:Transcript_41346/g.127790  ORF Transcript_41346/g.127790 Transcript_41346/m.127790 type:complete len:721 (+) Transcript_41346:122-2284(+)